MAFSFRKHYFLDLMAFLTFTISAFTGMVLRYMSPHGGAHKNIHYTVLTLSRCTWKTVHTWSSFLLVFLILMHLLVHKQWIVSMTKKIFKSKN